MKQLDDVIEWNEIAGNELFNGNGRPSRGDINLIDALLSEELDELMQGMHSKSRLETLDALCDIQYVLLGAVYRLGFAPVFEEAFDEVQRSNMTKFPEGVVTRRDDGKILKPDSYDKPDLTPFIS